MNKAMTSRELHTQAMATADKAWELHRSGNVDDAKALFAEAYRLEWQVAQASEAHPQREVMAHNAGWFALHAGLYSDALECVEYGLEGEPSKGLRIELLQLLSNIDHALWSRDNISDDELSDLIRVLGLANGKAVEVYAKSDGE